MAISTLPRDRRLQLRATASQETLIKVAAERQGVSVTDFIIRSACEKAEEVLLDKIFFTPDEKRFRQFAEILDAPLAHHARLLKLLSKRVPWDR